MKQEYAWSEESGSKRKKPSQKNSNNYIFLFVLLCIFVVLIQRADTKFLAYCYSAIAPSSPSLAFNGKATKKRLLQLKDHPHYQLMRKDWTASSSFSLSSAWRWKNVVYSSTLFYSCVRAFIFLYLCPIWQSLTVGSGVIRHSSLALSEITLHKIDLTKKNSI